MPRVPWYNRHREIEPRVHEELTETAANRMKFALDIIVSFDEIVDAYSRYKTEIGVEHDYLEVDNYGHAIDGVGNLFHDESLDRSLTFLEILIEILWTPSDYGSESHSAEALYQFDADIRRIFVEEGILLRLRPEQEAVKEHAADLYQYQNRSWIAVLSFENSSLSRSTSTFII